MELVNVQQLLIISYHYLRGRGGELELEALVASGSSPVPPLFDVVAAVDGIWVSGATAVPLAFDVVSMESAVDGARFNPNTLFPDEPGWDGPTTLKQKVRVEY